MRLSPARRRSAISWHVVQVPHRLHVQRGFSRRRRFLDPVGAGPGIDDEPDSTGSFPALVRAGGLLRLCGFVTVDARFGEAEYSLKWGSGNDEAPIPDSDDWDPGKVAVAACGFIGAVAADTE